MQLVTIKTLLGSIEICDITMCFTMYLCFFGGTQIEDSITRKGTKTQPPQENPRNPKKFKK